MLFRSLGGGGFCALDVGADGIERIEASLEFGGAFAINLGVAAGAVSAMAGIYLVYTVAKKSVELTGFVRIRGSLSVLGLITVSMEFYMGLAYDSSNGSVWGEASVKVEIELFFFTKHVTVKTRRKFAGGVGVALGELPERHYASIDDFSDEYEGDEDDEEFALQPPLKRPPVVSRPQPRATGALRAKDLLGSSELKQYCAAFA